MSDSSVSNRKSFFILRCSNAALEIWEFPCGHLRTERKHAMKFASVAKCFHDIGGLENLRPVPLRPYPSPLPTAPAWLGAGKGGRAEAADGLGARGSGSGLWALGSGLGARGSGMASFQL